MYNFAVGNPSLEPPREVLETLTKISNAALKKELLGLFKYTDVGGLQDLRSYIAYAIKNWQNVKEDLPIKNVVITPGAQSGMVNVFEALLQAGDIVLVQTPFYPLHMDTVLICGAESWRRLSLWMILRLICKL